MIDTYELIKDAVTEYLGERCDDFDQDCACCQTWKYIDNIKKMERGVGELR